jgi:hypothetical protein
VPQYLYRVQPARAEFYEAPTPEEIHTVDEHFLYLSAGRRKGPFSSPGERSTRTRRASESSSSRRRTSRRGADSCRKTPPRAQGSSKPSCFPTTWPFDRHAGARRRADPRFPESVAGVVDPETNLVVARPGRRVVGDQGHDDRFSVQAVGPRGVVNRFQRVGALKPTLRR